MITACSIFIVVVVVAVAITCGAYLWRCDKYDDMIRRFLFSLAEECKLRKQDDIANALCDLAINDVVHFIEATNRIKAMRKEQEQGEETE